LKYFKDAYDIMKAIKLKDIGFEIITLARIAELGDAPYEDKMKDLELATELVKKEYAYKKTERI
jgi:hypothetical protein